MLAPVEDEQFQFALARYPRPVPVEGADLPAVGTVGGFPGLDHRAPLSAQPVGQERQLGGLAGAVDTFEGDEQAALHETAAAARLATMVRARRTAAARLDGSAFPWPAMS